MNTSRVRTARAGAGLTLTALLGTAAFADDVELLLSTPGSGGADKPNILFILDSSGSMTTIERTHEPYNNSTVYSGDCDPSRVFWTTNDSPPSCGTDNWVSRSNFVCATGTQALDNGGTYSDTMAMYRRDDDRYKWRRPTEETDAPLECESDSGIHGDGDAQRLYAQIGSDVDPFTASRNREVSWGSSPTEQVLTVYSANYLNWYHYGPVTEMSRTDIVKSVTKNVLSSIQNANVGLMRFNTDQGGVVYHAVKDLDSNRAAVNAGVDALPASGWTPLSETMYEAARYWRGMTPHYGGSETDPEALAGTTYDQPNDFACAKNFNVLLSDGEPTQDTDANSRAPGLPNFATALGRSSCTGDGDGACLDDVAEYLSKEDTNTGVADEQLVATHTIGFSIDLPLLQATAENSGGKYYLANDVKSLTTALTEILTDIFERDVSFTAPAVSVNAYNRTQHLNDLYIATFRARNRTHWPGNLKKYKIVDGVITDKNGSAAVDPATGFFTESSHSYWTDSVEPDGANVLLGGATSQLPDPSVRRLFTNINGYDLTAANNAISTANAGSFTPQDFGLNGDPGEPTVDEMIQWARGVDVQDEDDDPNTLVRRVMGDTLHSQPASVVYGGSADNPDIVVFSATNDGYLHAVDAATGQELWSYIPAELLPELSELYYDNTISYKHYGIDGDVIPIVSDKNDNGKIDGNDFVYLVFGMRRGGNEYYALDVTDKNNPQIKWIRSHPQMGQTWSQPVVARVDAPGVNRHEAVIIVGGGYDTVHDQSSWPPSADAEGAAVYMFDLDTGTRLWHASATAGDLILPGMTRAFPSRIRVLDVSGDGLADRMYAVDIGGQLWRFDIFNGRTASELVTGGIVASVGAEAKLSPTAAETRRFYASPDVATFMDETLQRRYLAVSFGSGYRSHPLDESAEDRFYSFRDPHVFAQLGQSRYTSYPVATDADFVEVRGQVDVTLNDADRGWKYTLPPGEMVVVESRTFDDSVYFVSLQPRAASGDPCKAGQSVNRLYRVNVRNGDPVVDLDTLDTSDPAAIDDARVQVLEQGGIAPKPMFLFPSPDDPDCQDDECTPPPIGCVGVECFDPGFVNDPVRIVWKQHDVH